MIGARALMTENKVSYFFSGLLSFLVFTSYLVNKSILLVFFSSVSFFFVFILFILRTRLNTKTFAIIIKRGIFDSQDDRFFFHFVCVLFRPRHSAIIGELDLPDKQHPLGINTTFDSTFLLYWRYEIGSCRSSSCYKVAILREITEIQWSFRPSTLLLSCRNDTQKNWPYRLHREAHN